MKAHLYSGISPYLADAPFLSADELSQKVGGNAGNLLFCHAISRMLDVELRSIPFGGDVSALSAEKDRLVIPLANHLRPHSDLSTLAAKFRSVSVPMVGVGLGAQGPLGGIQVDSIPAGSWEWLKVLTSNSATERPNVSVRGKVTYDAIAKKGLADKCVITGCPSNFLNPSATLGREIGRRRANGLRRVAVTAGTPNLPQFKRLEQSLISLMEASAGLYVCQSPIDMLRLNKHEYGGIARATFQVYREHIHPDLDDDEFLQWFRRWSHVFTSAPEWLSVAKGFDLIIGTRIHGVMAGLQAGVPGLCLCVDSRTVELCETMLVPHVDANKFRDGIDENTIWEILRNWDWRAYDENRRILAQRFVKLFTDNQLECIGPPREILKTRSTLAVQDSEKSKSDGTHQVSTVSRDGRYPEIFAALKRALEPIAPKILSYGCSDGFETNDLARFYFHHATIIGCDVDLESIRIANKQNQFPSRVKIIESNRESLRSLAPFDAVVGMAVLCRWPQTAESANISNIYPFAKFAETVDFLVSLLRLGGILCISNANYRVTDSPAFHLLERIEQPGLIPTSQQVRLFDPSGTPLAVQVVDSVLFRKK